jgi:hypothetical protein
MSEIENFEVPEGCEDLNIKMSALGVIIINTDGTMSKIPNWNELTDLERTRAVRLIARRNQKRKEALIAQQAEEVAAAPVENIKGRRDQVEAATAAHLHHLSSVADERRELQKQGKILRCECCFGDYAESFEDGNDSTAIRPTSLFPSGYCQPCAQKKVEDDDEKKEVLMLENGP